MKKSYLVTAFYAAILLLPLLLFCALTLTVGAEEAPPPDPLVNVKDYGAVGDGETDDTASINAAAAILREGDTLYFPAGTYLLHEYGVPSVILVKDKKNISIRLEDGATLRLDTVEDGATGEQNRHYIFHLLNCEGVTLSGGRLYGDLETYTGSAFVDHGYAIRLADCTDVTVQGVEIAYMRGDGISVFSDTQDESGLPIGCYGVTVEDCEIHHCLRNGITLTSVDGCTVRDTVIHDVRGTMPQAALDIEAEYPGSRNHNVTVENCRFYGNGSWSITTAGDVQNLRVVSTELEERVNVGEGSRNVSFTDCTLGYIGFNGEDALLENCALTAACFYKGNATLRSCIFDGRDWITYRVLVTKQNGESVGRFENCTFYGRGLSALGGCIVLCESPPASLEFEGCIFKSCGLIPFVGKLGNVERSDCSFRIGWPLWVCGLALMSLAALLILRKRRKTKWVCK